MNIRLAGLPVLLLCVLPAGGEEPPYKRLLQGDDAKKAATLEKRIEELREAAKWAEAQKPAAEVLTLRKRVQGNAHWQTANALRTLQTLEHLAALPANTQAELAEAGRLDTEAAKFHARGRHAEAVPLLQRALELRRRHLGEEHFEVATAINNLAFFLAQSGRYREAQPLYQKVLGDPSPGPGRGPPAHGHKLQPPGDQPDAPEQV